jgi:ATP-binding cassette, sub-family E, member 1
MANRLAIIKRADCNPRKCSQECAKYCPVNRTGKECIIVGDTAQITEELCTGCGICPKKCPFDAIQIINLPHQLKEKPVFRYGKNAFELFRLPVPQKGKVVGILGSNGIGKSTALEILSGLLKPNLGEFERELLEKEIIDSFKGTELQAYFTKLFSQVTKVSYKPQYIDLIPNKFKGKVIDLLSNAGTKTQINEIAKDINIKDILQRNITKLSGGELQKVAIAAAILKKADLYLFDEPASYLDVKERVRVAKVIQKLAEQGKHVIVVEHDLIILDYLADLVHILFGQRACYGVVSHPLSAKNGVNTYLEGYLKDENIRFRDRPIKFDHHVTDRKQDLVVFTDWPDLKKKLGDFKLDIQSSELHEKEIVGIVGANAIGKTTFMKMIAGQLKPDSGKVKSKLKVSYKEQYIKATKGVTVMQALTAITKKVMTQSYKLDILRPLELEHLINHKLEDLSGGELQRVAIAVCLSRDADLYLFDEPSTYLDVEQRLMASRAIQKVIKNKKASALIIDHDLLFINFVSDRLMVFEGQPAKHGKANKIKTVKAGMNHFLKELNITLRKDPTTHRPRVNQPGSQKDKQQRKANKYYE